MNLIPNILSNIKWKGFGEADDEYGNILREVELEYVPNLLCSQLYSNVPASDIFSIHDSMMCAWKYEASPCYVSLYGLWIIF